MWTNKNTWENDSPDRRHVWWDHEKAEVSPVRDRLRPEHHVDALCGRSLRGDEQPLLYHIQAEMHDYDGPVEFFEEAPDVCLGCLNAWVDATGADVTREGTA